MEETNVPTIDRPTALALLQDAVSDRGWDYVYEKPNGSGACANVHETNDGPVPGCIVGYALISSGYITAEELLAGYKYSGARVLAEGLGYNQVVDIAPDAVELFHSVQLWQDRRVPWGAALVAATNVPYEVSKAM